MTTITPILTEAGLAAILAADASGLPARITHLALGSGGYKVATNSAGHATQTALNSEQERVDVLDVQSNGDRLMTVNTVVDTPSAYWLREFALVLSDGTLLAVWSGQGQPLAYKAANVPLYIGFELGVAALPADSVTFQTAGVDFDLVGLAALTAQVSARASDLLRQVKIFDQLREMGA